MRDLSQVVCGAYHSLALVRSLPQNSSSQKTPEKRERGASPHYVAAEREELFGADSAHYCPLGVELTEGAAAEVRHRAQSAGLFSTDGCHTLGFAFPELSWEEMPKAKAKSRRKLGQQQPRLRSSRAQEEVGVP